MLLRDDGLNIDPKRFRFFFVSFFVILLIMIWSGSFIALKAVRENLIISLKDRIEADTLVLEDHASRALDTVTARLESMLPLTTEDTIRVEALSVELLRQIVIEDRIVRSLSLIDPSGRVIASSNPGNLGITFPEHLLPAPRFLSNRPTVQFGSVLPYRDLQQAIQHPNDKHEDMQFWIAAMPVRIDSKIYQWVLTVNLSLFTNLWSRTDKDESTEIVLLDYAGKKIVSHHSLHALNQSTLIQLIIERVQARQRGFFELQQSQPIMVAYRASSDHPIILAIIGDVDIYLGDHDEEQNMLLVVAIALTVLLSVLMLFFYRWYLRYEVSVIEMSNQSRAIGAHLMVSESDIAGRITAANTIFLKVTGYELPELIGKNHRILNSGLYSKEYYTHIWQTITAGNIWKGTFRNRNKSGGYFWVNATIVPYKDAWGKVSRFVGFYSDITDAVSHSEKFEHERRLREDLARINQELITDANTDVLTGVANRRSFATFANQLLQSSTELTYPVSLMMLDLDFFKRVNDTHGHQAGDVVLKTLADRWKSQIRASDMLARLGGEEFCVLLHNATSAQAKLVADKLLAITSSSAVPYSDATGRTIRIPITVSIGLACADNAKGLLVDDLLRMADAALYEAKHAGRNRIIVKRMN